MAELRDRLSAAVADRYRLGRELGSGGMAIVYLAEDLKHHRQVALKVLREEFAAVIGAERFLREIEVTAKLQHPNILPLFDSGAASGFLYYVMPFVEGESLRHRLDRERQIPVDEVLEITRAIAAALDYAHSHNVVHRDIKPENILLHGGQAVVADFGIALAVSAAGGSRLTQTGLSVGTPMYMSPEQAVGSKHIDGRSDIYSLACVVYEMLTGEPPFTGPTAESVMRQHLVSDAPSVATMRAAVPPEVSEALARALAKTPADRFARASTFAQALRSKQRIAGRHWMTSALATSALIVVVAVAAFLFARRSKSLATVPTRVPRLVVLSFKNLGGPEDEDFAEGITAEITSKLSGLSGLGVIARTTAMQYKQSTKPLQQIAAELKADYILEGTVRRDRSASRVGRVRVTPELIRVADETQVWAQPKDDTLSDIFEFQAEIAEQVARAMDVTLLQPERRAVTALPTRSPEAYEVYLRGQAIWSRASGADDFKAAASMFARAVGLDSGFALAVAKLSQAYIGKTWVSGELAEADLGPAKKMANRALVLDPDSPAGHIALGYYLFVVGDLDGALHEYAIAQTAQPSNSELLELIGVALNTQGRAPEAVLPLSRALELDPRSARGAIALGFAHYVEGGYDVAQSFYDRALVLDPTMYEGIWSFKALAYAASGNEARAKEVTREASARLGLATVVADDDSWATSVHWLDETSRPVMERLAPTPSIDAGNLYLSRAEFFRLRGAGPRARSLFDSAAAVLRQNLASGGPAIQAYRRGELGIAYARLGQKADALREGRRAVELLPLSKNVASGMDCAMWLVDIYTIVGEYDAALEELESLWPVPGVAEEYRWKLQTDDVYAPLRTNPRFQKLVAGRG